MKQRDFGTLERYLSRIPSVRAPIGKGTEGEDFWWVKFGLDLDHPLAWSAVQELGYVLNYISVTERLPTVFKPVSPPPYLNGGPHEFLSWVIECIDGRFTPGHCAESLEERLPRPVEDPKAWTEAE